MARLLFITFLMLVYASAWAKVPVLTAEELATPPPRIIRTCCSFGADVGIAGIPLMKRTDITSLEYMGSHHYLGDENEGNGIIYTKRGGFIDLGHVRDCADWTAYLYSLITSDRSDSSILVKELGTEGGHKTLVINFPFESESPDAYQLAGRIAYDLSLWHEIATWFGASYIPLVPEGYSSFSPEDLYSNLLGVTLGIKALKSDLEYEDAMTLLIAEMLEEFEAVKTESETRTAMEQVESLWWSKEKRLPSKKVLLRRYFDADSSLVPWLVEGEEGRLPSHTLTKPGAQLSDSYELRIKLNYKFPVKAIFQSETDRTITQNDFGTMISYIEQDAYELGVRVADRSSRTKSHEKGL